MSWAATHGRSGLPVPGLLAILGLAVGGAWVWWLVGGSGWPLAAVDFAVALLTGALWLLSLQDAGAPRIDPLVGLIAVWPARSTASWPACSCPVLAAVTGRAASRSLAAGCRRPAPRPPASRPRSRRWSTSGSSTCHSAVWRCRPFACRRCGCPAGPALQPIVLPADDPAPLAPVSPVTAPPADDVDMDAPTMVHRILTSDEPLSVAAMRLAASRPATADVDPEDDETLPFPAVEPDGEAPGVEDADATTTNG